MISLAIFPIICSQFMFPGHKVTHTYLIFFSKMPQNELTLS